MELPCMSSLFIRLNRCWRSQRERSSTWPLHPPSTPGATSPSWNFTSVLSGHIPPCTMGKAIDRVALIAYIAPELFEMYGVACLRGYNKLRRHRGVRTCIYVFSTCENPRLILHLIRAFCFSVHNMKKP